MKCVRVAAVWITVCANSSAGLAQQISDFKRLCEKYLSNATSFVSECKERARPLRRTFHPSGRGAPVTEEHSAWFDINSSGSHFGVGCTLGASREVAYFGIYFFIQRDTFLLANSAPLRSIDFNGNVGLQMPSGEQHFLLAVQRFTIPGRNRQNLDRNCEIVDFNRATNTTALRSGVGFKVLQVSGDDPANIATCSGLEMPAVNSRCHRRAYVSRINKKISPIIFDGTVVKITEEARVYVLSELWNKVCKEGFRSSVEWVGFVKETCGLNEQLRRSGG